MRTIHRTFNLTRVQSDFRHSAALYRGFVGGRGAGKSFVGAYDLIRRAERCKTYLVVGPTYTSLRDSSLRSLLGIARDLGVLDADRLKKSAPPALTLTTGAEILFRSGDDPEKLRGPNLAGAWLDEASQMSRDAFDIVIGCLRQDGQQGWLSATFTPKGRLHWTYEVFGKGGPNVHLVQAPTASNPFNPPDFAALLAAQYHGARARQELGGEFTDVAGAEWPAEFFDWSGFWFREWPGNNALQIRVMALDPSKGADARTSDYQAIVLHGFDHNGGEWVEADMAGGDPETSPFPGRPMVAMRAPDGTALTGGMVERALELYGSFRPEALAIEVNQFQSLLLIPFRQVASIYGLAPNYALLDNRIKKAVRIRRMGEPLSQRRIRFRDTPMTRLLVDQLRTWNEEAEYDDGPDALEMARRTSVELWNGRMRPRQKGWRV
jgi:phage terminase large subunit-like protein